MANVYEQVKQAIQDVVAPNLAKIEGKIEGLSGEMKGLGAEIRRLDEKIDNLDKRLNEKMDFLHREMDTRFSAMDDKIDFALEFKERMTTLEAKVAALTHNS